MRDDIIYQKSWKFLRELNSETEEQLDKKALVNDKHAFTYRQMFRKWELFARIFSGLGITGKNGSKVGMITNTSIEEICVFYGLNMVGTSVSMINNFDTLDHERFAKMVKKEGLTDLVLPTNFTLPDFLTYVTENKAELGLNHIIVLPIDMSSDIVPEDQKVMAWGNMLKMRFTKNLLFMNDLHRRFRHHEIEYCDEIDEAAVIVHTSGTTSGIHKPIPLSDSALNEGVARLLRDEKFEDLKGEAVVYQQMDTAGAYGIVDIVHLPFAFGGTLVSIPLIDFGADHHMNEVNKMFGVNVLFGAGMLFEILMRAEKKPDFSDMKLIYLGGAYVSSDARKRFNDFVKECGSKVGTSIGYGLSEAAAACIVSTNDRLDDSIGYPLPGVEVRIYDEDEDKFYKIEDGERRGVMFLSTPSLSGGKIGDEVFFELDEIDGETYLNTYDAVKVNADGSLTYVGRMNKFFVNNEGIRFDAGLIEKAISEQPGIEACGLAPEYNRMLHDSIPVLYVQTTEEVDSETAVREALCKVFVEEGSIEKSNLPAQVVLTKEIPYTKTGKVDVYQILNQEVKGTRLRIEAIREKDELTDIQLHLVSNMDFFGGETNIPEELAEAQALVAKFVAENMEEVKEKNAAEAAKQEKGDR